MNIHHIQKAIIEKLATEDALSFSTLKIADIENKLFTYHLKQTIANKLVQKNSVGMYELTMTGRKAWKRISLHTEDIVNRALSVIYVAVKNSDQWLVYKRKTHPFLGYYAFPHLIPDVHVSVLQATKDYLTILGQVHPVIKASGFFRMLTSTGAVEGFTNFTLVYVECTSEILLPNTEYATFEWVNSKEIQSLHLIPNMSPLLLTLENNVYEFIDSTLLVK